MVFGKRSFFESHGTLHETLHPQKPYVDTMGSFHCIFLPGPSLVSQTHGEVSPTEWFGVRLWSGASLGTSTSHLLTRGADCP